MYQLRNAPRSLVVAVAFGFGGLGALGALLARASLGEPAPPAAAAARAPAIRAAAATSASVPITTSSEAARRLYLAGRELLENRRVGEARAEFAAAIARDPSFALAHLGMANTARTEQERVSALDHAIAFADRTSPGEQLMIRGVQAGATGAPAVQQQLYIELVQRFPRDARPLSLLAAFHLGQQDGARAIELCHQAIAIAPSFPAPYRLLGQAERLLGHNEAAERALRHYIALIPDDPDPYDSVAELLMKRGRFDESIRSYERAIAIDRNFASAYIGIANDYMFSDRGAQAREALGRLLAVARDPAERRQAIQWTAVSFTHEAAWDQALAEIDQLIALDDQAGDLGQKARDLDVRGNILLEAGRPDEAAAAFRAQLEASEQASIPADVKETARRNALYDDSRVALARHDLPTARECAAGFAQAVAAKQIGFEIRRQHELAGMIALAEGRPRVALAELAQADQQDPRVLYLTATALGDAGDAAKARAAARRAAEFNGLALDYGYVRAKARALATS